MITKNRLPEAVQFQWGTLSQALQYVIIQGGKIIGRRRIENGR
ncbi:hypothetical protein MNBD_GAMMA16-876 [hydrothermal vent metagenome]|uniref:Uncharacterized protein n=1 Tax=hydrothermal vent metagenome TaxID=652676 RepID=A0A3B0YTQ7_9ZZZZ